MSPDRAGPDRVGPDRLAGVIAHELRNPLASAITGAMLAREMVDADDPRATVLDGVLRDMDRLTGLVNGWLLLARGGKVAGRRVGVDDLVRSVAARHGAEVVICPSEPAIHGDRVLLERALDNLCENARQAGARAIRIAVQELGDAVTIHVEDDGSGVQREDVDRIFTAGWTKQGGTGLGLHAVAVTIAAHRGTVRCVPLAHGTRFTLSLPGTSARAALA